MGSNPTIYQTGDRRSTHSAIPAGRILNRTVLFLPVALSHIKTTGDGSYLKWRKCIFICSRKGSISDWKVCGWWEAEGLFRRWRLNLTQTGNKRRNRIQWRGIRTVSGVFCVVFFIFFIFFFFFKGRGRQATFSAIGTLPQS